jgi:hypothetical protein
MGLYGVVWPPRTHLFAHCFGVFDLDCILKCVFPRPVPSAAVYGIEISGERGARRGEDDERAKRLVSCEAITAVL